ncbi:MAG TPA: MFS transporter [Bryobacteraceae bacterium]|jgi:sugar phosphate permease|nr:MFS transporter [Bryobacteraceae bacterium]
MSVPVRYKVVGVAASLAALTYLDRVCISVLAPSIQQEFSLTQVQMSWVFSAFTISYAMFEIPTAWWADKIGSRRVLTRIVAWWSTFTMATASAFSYTSMLTLRFLFGIGEAGAWPNAARVFSRWIPARERGVVQGLFFAGAHLSGALTPAIVIWMTAFLSWRQVFMVCGSIGFLWAFGWYRWFRDEPGDHPSVTPQERDMILRERNLPPHEKHDAKSFAAVFRNPSSWLLCLMYMANTYGFYFFITWLPTYLEKIRGFAREDVAVYAGLPLGLSVAADVFGGVITDRLVKRFGARLGRCSVGFIGYAIAAVTMMIAAGSNDAKTSAILIGVAGAASMFTLAPSWACCIDIGEHRAGVLGAVMNTSGNIAGALSPLVLAYLVRAFSDWAIPLYVLAALYLIAAICWLLIRPDRPISKMLGSGELYAEAGTPHAL